MTAMVCAPTPRRIAPALTALLAVLLPHSAALAHGSVTPDADLCIIRIGFYRAHFKIYQPDSRGHREYCEDLPDRGSSVFIMEYEHDGLAAIPIEFRIIENTTGQGRFTNQAMVEAIDDIEAVTVFHRPAGVQRDVFTAIHEFVEDGEYVGIVTVPRPDGDGSYRAVFPFEVGYTGLGFWPWVIAAVVLLQLNYWWMSGRFRRRRVHGTASVGAIGGSRHD